jgi:hypothetical protein
MLASSGQVQIAGAAPKAALPGQQRGLELPAALLPSHADGLFEFSLFHPFAPSGRMGSTGFPLAAACTHAIAGYSHPVIYDWTMPPPAQRTKMRESFAPSDLFFFGYTFITPFKFSPLGTTMIALRRIGASLGPRKYSSTQISFSSARAFPQAWNLKWPET